MSEFKKFFEHLGTFETQSDHRQQFIVKDHFSLRKSSIESINVTFSEWFLKGDGKIESPENDDVEMIPINLYASRSHAKWNQETIDLLGGFDSVVLTFREVNSILKRCRFKDANDSYKGLRGRETFFHARDTNNVIRCIKVVFTRDSKMYVSAYKIFDKNLGRIMMGTRFLSYLKVRY